MTTFKVMQKWTYSFRLTVLALYHFCELVGLDSWLIGFDQNILPW